jgi:hypothetical protein
MKLERVTSWFGRFGEVLGGAGLSANDDAMVIAYEMLGNLLARRFDTHGAPALAAASAGLIDPEARKVLAHLNAGAQPAQIVAASQLLQPVLQHVTAEYLKPEEPSGKWRLKISCAVIMGGKESKASLTRELDWSELPDIVRGSYMRGDRETYVLTLFPRAD